MKYLVPKLIFIVILVLGISSFVMLKSDNGMKQDQDEIVNTRFDGEMDNGFEDREVRF